MGNKRFTDDSIVWRENFLSKCNESGRQVFEAVFRVAGPPRWSSPIVPGERGFSFVVKGKPVIWGFPVDSHGDQRMEFKFRRQGDLVEDCSDLIAAVAELIPLEDLRPIRRELKWFIRGPLLDGQIEGIADILKRRIRQMEEPLDFDQ